MKNLTILTLLIFALALVGCETVPETNSNTAVVTDENANTVTDADTDATDADEDWDWDMTREDFDKDKDKYAERAKKEYEDDTIGSGANDVWLWFKTRGSLATIDDLRDSTINVDVENAVVTLKGTVASEAGMKAAEEAAKKIEGVSSVKNELKVDKGDSMTNQATTDDGEESSDADSEK